jgi:hypothetical protein
LLGLTFVAIRDLVEGFVSSVAIYRTQGNDYPICSETLSHSSLRVIPDLDYIL